MYKLTFWVKCDGWKKGGYSNAHYFKNRKEADEWLRQPNIHAKELSFEKVTDEYFAKDIILY